jgi:hypothetical protein
MEKESSRDGDRGAEDLGGHKIATPDDHPEIALAAAIKSWAEMNTAGRKEREKTARHWRRTCKSGGGTDPGPPLMHLLYMTALALSSG